jgi:hypothetical protein
MPQPHPSAGDYLIFRGVVCKLIGGLQQGLLEKDGPFVAGTVMCSEGRPFCMWRGAASNVKGYD